MFKKARYVLAVYHEGSFTKAAEKLYISQPCLSTAVKQLENEIGAPLFVRAASSVLPTELGLEYIRVAEKIIALEDDFSEHIRQSSSLSRGSLRVGGSNYVSSYILPRAVDKFTKLYPNVTVTLTEKSSTELMAMLQNGELDVIADSFDHEPDGCILHPISTESILLAVPSSLECNKEIAKFGISPLDIFSGARSCRDLGEVGAEHFKNEKFILLKSGHSMYGHAMDIFRRSGFTPNVSMYLDQLSTTYFLASQGNGCCFVTDTLFRYHKFDDPILLYNVGGGERTLGIAYKKNSLSSAAILKFIQICNPEAVEEVLCQEKN